MSSEERLAEALRDVLPSVSCLHSEKHAGPCATCDSVAEARAALAEYDNAEINVTVNATSRIGDELRDAFGNARERTMSETCLNCAYWNPKVFNPDGPESGKCFGFFTEEGTPRWKYKDEACERFEPEEDEEEENDG